MYYIIWDKYKQFKILKSDPKNIKFSYTLSSLSNWIKNGSVANIGAFNTKDEAKYYLLERKKYDIQKRLKAGYKIFQNDEIYSEADIYAMKKQVEKISKTQDKE